MLNIRALRDQLPLRSMVTLLVVLAACGSSETPGAGGSVPPASTSASVGGSEPGEQASPRDPLLCGDDRDAIAAVILAGQPTFELSEVRDLDELIAQNDVVVAATVSSVERIEVETGEFDGDVDRYATYTLDDVDVLAGRDADAAMFDWSIGDVLDPDPLAASVRFEGVRVVAFLERQSSFPSGLSVSPRGFVIGCAGTDEPGRSMFGALPADATGLSLDQLGDAVRASAAAGEPDPIAVAAVHTDVAFYPACGNETLTFDGVTYFTLSGAARDAFNDRRYEDPRTAVAVATPTGMARIAPPGPGDDIGTLVVYEDGHAYFETESGNDVWLTDEVTVYEFEC